MNIHLTETISSIELFFEKEYPDLSTKKDLVNIFISLQKKATASELDAITVSLLTLPLLSFAALGKNPADIYPVNAAWISLYNAFNLLDKIEDHEADNVLSEDITDSTLLNLTTSLLFTAESFLHHEQSCVNQNQCCVLQKSLNKTALIMCSGQHQDLSLQEPSLTHVWKIAEEKSGAFFALACYWGAYLANTLEGRHEEKTIENFKLFGNELGLLIQLANDIEGLWGNEKKKSDLQLGKWTFPVAYAMQVLEPSETNLLREFLRNGSYDENAEKKARAMIIHCGALVYLYLEIEKHKQIANNLLISILNGNAPNPAMRGLMQTIKSFQFVDDPK